MRLDLNGILVIGLYGDGISRSKKHLIAILIASGIFGLLNIVFSGTLSVFTISKAWTFPSLQSAALMKGMATFFIIDIVSSALTITNISFMIYFKHWCNDEFTAPAA